jgi:hypothetical protein
MDAVASHCWTRPVSKKLSPVAYWSVLDACVELWVLGVGRVWCSLKRLLNFERARHVARSGAPDAAECVWCLCVRASGAPDLCPTALFEGVSLYIHVWPAKGALSWIFWHPNVLLSLAYFLSLISLAWLTNQSEFEWLKCICFWVCI